MKKDDGESGNIFEQIVRERVWIGWVRLFECGEGIGEEWEAKIKEALDFGATRNRFLWWKVRSFHCRFGIRREAPGNRRMCVRIPSPQERPYRSLYKESSRHSI